MRVHGRLLYAVLLAVLVSACSHAHAKTSPDNPALDVPAPPQHEVEPSENDAPPPVPLPQEPARNTPARPRSAPPREQPRAEPPRQEPPKPEPAPPATEPPKPEETPRPPTTLQTMPTTAEGGAERAIRALLLRANNDLNRVDYRALNADARNQYDTAKQIIQQAERAISGKNLAFAKTLADKAAALAAQLAGR
jgi:outer membrane biosynthesis protein TonB